MKTVRWKILTMVGWLASATAALPVVESTSESFVGAATVIKGNGGSGSRVTCLSLPVVGPVLAAGTITGLGANTMLDANANWQAGAFSGNNGSFYMELDSGLMVEVFGADAASKTVTLQGDIRNAASVGARYRIRKHFTIADIFGANNEIGLRGGMNDASADNLMLYLPQSQTTLTLFCFSLSNAWYTAQYQPAGNTTVYPEQGIFVRRKQAGDVALYVHGQAKDGATQAPVYTGFNLVGTLKGAKSVRLADLNLYTGNAGTGVAADVNYQLADNLRLLNADGSTSTYFYYPGYGWVDFSYSPANDVLVAPGSAFFIIRKAPRGLFFWSIPAE